MYVPTPPLPVPIAVTTVPAAIPGPTTGEPTASEPDVTELTERVLPEIEPIRVTTGGAAAIAVLATVCGTLTVYVPTPPLPVPTAVTTVPAAMPGPTIIEPTARVPDDTELTESVLPEMDPVSVTDEEAVNMLVLSTVCVAGAATV